MHGKVRRREFVTLGSERKVWMWSLVFFRTQNPPTAKHVVSSLWCLSLISVSGLRLRPDGVAFHQGPNKHISISILWDIPTLLGFLIRGFIWDIPILIFA